MERGELFLECVGDNLKCAANQSTRKIISDHIVFCYRTNEYFSKFRKTFPVYLYLGLFLLDFLFSHNHFPFIFVVVGQIQLVVEEASKQFLSALAA